ncbi:MAG: hypothetical protein A2Z37_03000 [Chloroflexi bacterium RBG_19FT_COMBO_62_14]|nr:MAG: hypothetical protein A2Z37_03000 [Chloroflexi bacterium RBG_19FT_COMBO_62_14]
MTTESNKPRSAFTWNVGGWFGSQIGGTLWLLILGLLLLSIDSLTAWVSLGSYGVLNAWGLYLWGARRRISAYAAIQFFLSAASVFIALVVSVANSRGLSQPPAPGVLVSTSLPWGVIAVAPGLMVWFFLMELRASRTQD